MTEKTPTNTTGNTLGEWTNTERDNWKDITASDATGPELLLVHKIFGPKPGYLSDQQWRENMRACAADIRAHVKAVASLQPVDKTGTSAGLEQELTDWLDSQEITSDNIGYIRRSCFMPWDSKWNGVVRDETAKRENRRSAQPTKPEEGKHILLTEGTLLRKGDEFWDEEHEAWFECNADKGGVAARGIVYRRQHGN